MHISDYVRFNNNKKGVAVLGPSFRQSKKDRSNLVPFRFSYIVPKEYNN